MWYEKAVEKYGKKALSSAIGSVAITALFSFWYFASGRSFMWHSISPIPQPGFLDSELYGAVAFMTIGAFLYYVVKLWKILKIICVDVLNSWELYNGVKGIVWAILLLITQFYIVPTIIDWANAIVSFLYNMFFLFLYIFPPFGILLAGFLLALLFCRREAEKPQML